MEFKDLYLKRRTCRSYEPIEVEEETDDIIRANDSDQDNPSDYLSDNCCN